MTVSERLKRATDVDTMKEWFQEHVADISLSASVVDDLYVPRVFPHRDGGFAIQYSVRATGDHGAAASSAILWGHLLDDGQDLPPEVAHHDGRYIVSETVRLIVPLFPFDPRLRIIEAMVQPGGELPHPTECIPGSPFDSTRYCIRSAQLLSYRLARRCTLKLRLKPAGSDGADGEWTLVAKVLRPRRAKALYESSRSLVRRGFATDAADRLTIPQTYALDPANGVVYMESVAGVTLHDAVETEKFAEISREAGRILRKLHSLDTSGEVIHTAADELSGLRRLANAVCSVFPEIAVEVARVIASLDADLPRTTDFLPAVIHRDFFDKQVLYCQQRTCLLDWTPGAAGDPALDVGNFLAHQRLRALQHPESAPLIEAGYSSFADGYMSTDIVGCFRVQWWKAAALVRLACLYALRPRWRTLAPELLREAALYQVNDSRPGGRNV